MPVFTSSIEVTADYPTIKPSLNLNFARARALDPRVGFERASVGTYVGRDGLIKTAGEDEARFDHDPDTLESLGLLIEESRTNIVVYSEEFNNNWWSKSGGGNPGTTVTANQEVAPDGTTTADYIDYTTATAASQNVEVSYDNNPAGKIYTGSVWIKGTAGQTFYLTLDANGVNGSAQQFTLNGDWQRFSITREYPAGSPAAYFRFGIRNLNHPSTGTATQVYAWGAQIELGSFSTSYIPTSGSSVTRQDDFGYLTGENFSSWFNQTEGSLDVGYRLGYDNVGMRVCQISNQNSSTAIDLVVGSGGGAGGYWFIITGGVSQFSATGVTNSSQVGADRNFRCVLAYKENDCAGQQDKVSTISTDTSVTLATDYDRLLFYQIANSGDQIQGHLKYIRYYPKRITNAQVTQLSQDGI